MTRFAGIRRLLLFLAAAAGATPLTAQVGYPPSKSPYRDLTRGNFLVFTASRFGGGGGAIGILPHDGTMYGGRIEFLSNRAISFGVGFSTGTLDRLIVDPFDRVATRVKGPVNQRLSVADLAVTLNVTGGKTWHHLAPYVGGGLGIAWTGSTTADTSGFDFGTKLLLNAHIGTRIFLSRSLYLRAQATGTFFRVTYPVAFAQEPPREPGTPENSNAVFPDGNRKEWVASGVLQIGLGMAVSFPF